MVSFYFFSLSKCVLDLAENENNREYENHTIPSECNNNILLVLCSLVYLTLIDNTMI